MSFRAINFSTLVVVLCINCCCSSEENQLAKGLEGKWQFIDDHDLVLQFTNKQMILTDNQHMVFKTDYVIVSNPDKGFKIRVKNIKDEHNTIDDPFGGSQEDYLYFLIEGSETDRIEIIPASESGIPLAKARLLIYSRLIE